MNNHDLNDSLKELKVLLKYMIEHNESHNKEVIEIGSSLKANGLDEAFKQVELATKEFSKGNEYLTKALTIIEGK